MPLTLSAIDGNRPLSSRFANKREFPVKRRHVNLQFKLYVPPEGDASVSPQKPSPQTLPLPLTMNSEPRLAGPPCTHTSLPRPPLIFPSRIPLSTVPASPIQTAISQKRSTMAITPLAENRKRRRFVSSKLPGFSSVVNLAHQSLYRESIESFYSDLSYQHKYTRSGVPVIPLCTSAPLHC